MNSISSLLRTQRCLRLLNTPQRRFKYSDILNRPPVYIYDYMSPTPSHLLNITLADFLPKNCHPPPFNPSNLALPSILHQPLLPQGHHLVYFPPQVLSSDLLPDGTDPLQSPGPPFVRRMWAGGSLSFDFNEESEGKMELLGMRAVCRETVVGVGSKGEGEGEKVFVSIERAVGMCGEGGGELEDLGVTEVRNLVFMREKSEEEARRDAARPDRVVKPVHVPDIKIPLTPTQALLFRFSALTFNAHGIHLDRQYCREVEGRRNLLVHGPLSLVFMLSVLRGQMGKNDVVLKFDYRNLAPLYCEEEMNVCVREDKGFGDEQKRKFDVWIEGLGGGYAVKGSAVVMRGKEGEGGGGDA